MTDLRIIIVSWNVEQHLERCLRSLSPACAGLEWDCVVVDNNSSDGSVSVAERMARERTQIRVMANKNNRGFVKACNQGLMGLNAQYVLLLNPDTECLPETLTRLVRAADRNPYAGIIGPKLLNSDGSLQASIRRFPTFWSQLGIMLKTHNLLPALFGRYFARDLSLDEEQDVDQVMGSCFLIRREVIEQIGGLDERYFIWFEEVDYCRMARERGWTVRYVPSVAVTHHGGQSFDQVFGVKKQRYFNDSLVKFFQKWQPGWRPAVLRVAAPLSLALARLAGSLGLGSLGSKRVLSTGATPGFLSGWKWWSLIVLILELVSALTIFRPSANSIATLVVAFIIAVLAWKRPTLALAALLMELMIGSKGYLLQLGFWPDAISLRIVLFAVFMFGWATNRLQSGARRGLKPLIRGRIEYLPLYIVIGYAALRGALLGNEFVGPDANAWGFLLLLIPVLDLASRYNQQLRRDVLPVLIVAPAWLALKTLGLEYIFSHGFESVSQPTYLWVRRTGAGEVTLITANAFRIFMQSYIFALPALFFGANYYFATHERGLKQKHVVDVIVLSAFIVLLVSLSRSLWIGAASGILTVLWCSIRGADGALLLRIRKGMSRLITGGGVALALIFIALSFPIPRVDVASLATLFGSRISTEDAAARSRWKLLPVVWEKIKKHPVLGSGFGATVTYETSDPRIVAQTGGKYTTYAFEWGWLEHWVKFGFFGMLLMLAVVWRLGQRIARLNEQRWMVTGALATLVGVAVTHFFTPYLNHPLGFALLLLGEGWVMSGQTSNKADIAPIISTG